MRGWAMVGSSLHGPVGVGDIPETRLGSLNVTCRSAPTGASTAVPVTPDRCSGLNAIVTGGLAVGRGVAAAAARSWGSSPPPEPATTEAPASTVTSVFLMPASIRRRANDSLSAPYGDSVGP